MKILYSILLASVILFMTTPAFGFACPRHFSATETNIAEVSKALQASSAAKSDKALVHALLDDAKMLLEGARHNHAKPQGKYDHARSIAKADSALKYAEAASLLLNKI